MREINGNAHPTKAGEFNYQDVFCLDALCSHISACLAMLRQPQVNDFLNTNNTNLCLTPREKEIITLVSKGHTNGEIAKALWIKEDSVKQALKRLFKKLQVRNRVELIDKCIFGVVNS